MTNSSTDDNDLPALGLAIVGCGQIVTHHLEAIASRLQGRVVLRALCDPSEERRSVIQTLPFTSSLLFSSSSSKESLATFDSLDQLISNTEIFANVDIIFIAVPHDLHETLAVKALEESVGKFVVMEKPLAPTWDACDRLVELSKARTATNANTTSNTTTSSSNTRAVDTATTTTNTIDSMLIIAEQSPHWEEVVRAKELIENGAIGQIVTAAAYYYESMRDNITSGSVDASTGGLGWRGSLARAGGGITIDGGLHWIRPLREMLGGRIEEVIGIVRKGLAPELQMEGEVLGHALFKMTPPIPCSPARTLVHPLIPPPGTGPLIATYSCNMLATAPMAHDACPYFRITGTKGELIIHGTGLAKHVPGAGGLRLYDEDHPTGIELFDSERKGGFFLGFAGLWEKIHQICIQRDYQAAHDTVVRASDDVKVALALYKSSESGRWEST